MSEPNIYTVVVADDEQELREAVCAMIPWESLGFRLLASASNGLDALELVERLEPDLLLTDIRMPFLSGIELARHVREVRPAMSIAFLSGYDDFEYAQQAIQYNIISYMLKPITMDGLAGELRAIHDKMDSRMASLRGSTSVQSDRAAFVIPLLLASCDYRPRPGIEEALRKDACACGLLRGPDDLPRFVVLCASVFDSAGVNVTAPEHVHTMEQVAEKYLRSYTFYARARVVMVLMGNPSDFEEYLHILADEICQIIERVFGLRGNVGVSRSTDQLYMLDKCCAKAVEALRVSEMEDGGVSFNSDLRKTGTSLCERALALIDKNYGDVNLSLVSLSSMLDVSPNHLSACIKHTTGDTFINTLIRKRMEAAYDLVLNTDLKVAEIARRCGYVDQHYFSYCFKKFCGESPNVLRRRQAVQDGGVL